MNFIASYFSLMHLSKERTHLFSPQPWLPSRQGLLHLCREVTHPLDECPVYDKKLFDGEVPVMLELWGIQSTLTLPSLPAPVWPGVVAPERILSMGQIELNCVLMLNLITWNRTFLTCKQHTYGKLNCLK